MVGGRRGGTGHTDCIHVYRKSEKWGHRLNHANPESQKQGDRQYFAQPESGKWERLSGGAGYTHANPESDDCTSLPSQSFGFLFVFSHILQTLNQNVV